MHELATDRDRVLNLRLRLGWSLWYVVGGVVLWAWGWWISLAYDFGMRDESWFLQVLTRVVRGDVLYRDVFFGATPLSVYLAAPLIAVFGSEILVVKAFVSLCFMLTVLLCGAMLRRLGGSQRSTALLLFALLAYVWPRQAAGYSPLAYTYLLGCLAVMLVWRERLREVVCTSSGATHINLLALAGGVAGLCFGAKQNVGAYLLVALVSTTALTLLRAHVGWRKACVAAVVIIVAFLLVSLVILLPVVLSGGMEEFLDYGFTNKRTYLRVSSLSYFDGVRALAKRVQTIGSLEDMRWVYLQTIFLLPPLALVTAAIAWVAATQEQRGYLIIIGSFVAVALLGIYPRADIEHVIYAVPVLLLCLVYASNVVLVRLSRYGQQILQASLLLWFVLGIALIGSGALGRTLSPDYELSTLPHFRGVRLAKQEHVTLHRHAMALRATSDSQPFLLTPFAAFFYLVTGLENPTPFDYPLVTAFGLHGQADVMAAIQKGNIRSVCVKRRRGYRLSPDKLEQFIVDHMESVSDLEFCTLYRTHSPHVP
jgi:hypothetical protein